MGEIYCIGMPMRGLHSFVVTDINRWKMCPVPPTAPFPYNDQSCWGIVPAWGYATVTESNVPGMPPDSLIWGYWPTSTSLTLLRLEPSDPEGHWVEVSSHRQQLMPI